MSNTVLVDFLSNHPNYFQIFAIVCVFAFILGTIQFLTIWIREKKRLKYLEEKKKYYEERYRVQEVAR